MFNNKSVSVTLFGFILFLSVLVSSLTAAFASPSSTLLKFRRIESHNFHTTSLACPDSNTYQASNADVNGLYTFYFDILTSATDALITGGVLRLFDPSDLGIFGLSKVATPPSGVITRYEAVGVTVVTGVEYDGHAAVQLTDGSICSTNGASLKIATPPAVQISATEVYTVQHAFALTCLDLDSGFQYDGAKLQGWDCQAGNNHQLWEIVDRGSGFFSFVNAGTGTSVTLLQGDTTNGTPFQSFATNAADPSQQFQLSVSSIGADGTQTVFILPRDNSAKVLDLDGPSSNDGTLVHIWDNVNLPFPYQRWILTPAGNVSPPPPPPPPPPSTPTITAGASYAFRHALTGTCLDLNSGSSLNGAKLQGWACGDSNLNQRWQITARAGGLWSIVNEGTGTSVDLRSGLLFNGNFFQSWATNPTNPNQLFKLFLDSTLPDGEQQIRVVPDLASGDSKLMDLDGPSAADGTQVHVWDNVHLPNALAQRWIIKLLQAVTPPPPFPSLNVVYQIRHGLTGTCLDLDSGFTYNGAKLQGWDCQNGNNNQRWTLQARTGGYYSIINAGTGTSVDLTAGQTFNGNLFHSWATDPNNVNQLFSFHSVSSNGAGDSTAYVVPFLGPTKVMDLDGPSANDGTAVHIWDNVGLPAPAQMWIFHIVP